MLLIYISQLPQPAIGYLSINFETHGPDGSLNFIGSVCVQIQWYVTTVTRFVQVESLVRRGESRLHIWQWHAGLVEKNFPSTTCSKEVLPQGLCKSQVSGGSIDPLQTQGVEAFPKFLGAKDCPQSPPPHQQFTTTTVNHTK